MQQESMSLLHHGLLGGGGGWSWSGFEHREQLLSTTQ